MTKPERKVHSLVNHFTIPDIRGDDKYPMMYEINAFAPHDTPFVNRVEQEITEQELEEVQKNGLSTTPHIIAMWITKGFLRTEVGWFYLANQDNINLMSITKVPEGTSTISHNTNKLYNINIDIYNVFRYDPTNGDYSVMNLNSIVHGTKHIFNNEGMTINDMDTTEDIKNAKRDQLHHINFGVVDTNSVIPAIIIGETKYNPSMEFVATDIKIFSTNKGESTYLIELNRIRPLYRKKGITISDKQYEESYITEANKGFYKRKWFGGGYKIIKSHYLFQRHDNIVEPLTFFVTGYSINEERLMMDLERV